MGGIELQQTRRRLALACFLLASGCTRNADLEVVLDLPPAPGSQPMFAFVQFDRPPADITQVWSSTSDFDGTPLRATERTPARYSLLTEDVSRDVLVKVRFCDSPRCGGDSETARLFVLQRPFHFAQRTEWDETIATLPTTRDPEPETIDRCRIAGCIVPYMPHVWYCREDGTHFCDPPSTAAPDGGTDASLASPDAFVPSDGGPDAARDAAHDAWGDR